MLRVVRRGGGLSGELACAPPSCLGLSGLDLPSLLIKMAAADLQGEFPHMGVFYTLSPVFGFRRWLDGQLRKMEHGGWGSYGSQSKVGGAATADRVRRADHLMSACSVLLSVCVLAADLSGVRGEERLLEWFPVEGGKEGTAGILKVMRMG